MNILIKGSDFSEVSIGTAGLIQRSALLSHLVINPNNWTYSPSPVCACCYDVTNIKKIIATAYKSQYSGTSNIGYFYNNDLIT